MSSSRRVAGSWPRICGLGVLDVIADRPVVSDLSGSVEHLVHSWESVCSSLGDFFRQYAFAIRTACDHWAGLITTAPFRV
jgi:hypothetical protein